MQLQGLITLSSGDNSISDDGQGVEEYGDDHETPAHKHGHTGVVVIVNNDASGRRTLIRTIYFPASLRNRLISGG